jgi:hypothetical protein
VRLRIRDRVLGEGIKAIGSAIQDTVNLLQFSNTDTEYGVNCKPRCSAQSDNGDKGSRKQYEDG